MKKLTVFWVLGYFAVFASLTRLVDNHTETEQFVDIIQLNWAAQLRAHAPRIYAHRIDWFSLTAEVLSPHSLLARRRCVRGLTASTALGLYAFMAHFCGR